MNELFREVPLYDLTDNFFKLINEDWMLITAGKPDCFHIKHLIPGNYPEKDFHKFYIGEIEHCYLK